MPTYSCDENWGRAFFDRLRAEDRERLFIRARTLIRDARHADPDNLLLEAIELCLIRADVP